MIRYVFFLGTLLTLFGREQQNVTPESFLLNKSKPWAYLSFDHVGVKSFLVNGQVQKGLWLRLTNNCSIPLLIRGAASSDRNRDGSVVDEVVPEGYVTDMFASVKEQRRKIHERERYIAKQIPIQNVSDTAEITEVPPGGSILFSEPFNHVDDHWYIRIIFSMKVKTVPLLDAPFSEVTFHKWQMQADDQR